jgi:hypothetical protein
MRRGPEPATAPSPLPCNAFWCRRHRYSTFDVKCVSGPNRACSAIRPGGSGGGGGFGPDLTGTQAGMVVLWEGVGSGRMRAARGRSAGCCCGRVGPVVDRAPFSPVRDPLRVLRVRRLGFGDVHACLRNSPKAGTSIGGDARMRAVRMDQWGTPRFCGKVAGLPVLCFKGRGQQTVQVAARQAVAARPPQSVDLSRASSAGGSQNGSR